MRNISSPVSGFVHEMTRKKSLYLMLIPGTIALFLFNYLPLFGIVVAFMDYNIADGIFKSRWVGFDNFQFFLTSEDGWRAIRNTLYLNGMFILVHTVLQILFALLLNEVSSRFFKKFSQSLIFLPYFISWIVVSVFIFNLFNFEYGTVNALLKEYGKEPSAVFSMPEVWPFILILIDSWRRLGFGMIIYLAALAGINEEYYDAAVVDGASRWQRIRHISIPLIMPVVTILTLLDIGRILNADFGMFYGLIGDNSVLFPTTDVFDTFVYRNLRVLGDMGMASAAGLFQSVVGFILVLFSNLAARKFQEDGALF